MPRRDHQRHIIHALAAALLIAIGSSAVFAQSSGGSSGSSGGSSGASGASGTSGASAAGGTVGSPAAGSAGAGSLGTSGVPRGPGNAAGLNNSGNDPSGAGNAATFSPGTTTGLANPSSNASPRITPANPEQRSDTTPPRGTNALGTANSGGGGIGASTSNERDSDAKIDAENRKLDRMVKSICKGC